MSTLLRVRDGIAHISSGHPEPTDAAFLTAIVEARGALLHWQATGGATLPDADVDDPVAAAGWLADVYGPTVAAAVIRAEDASIAVADPAGAASGDARIIDAVLRLGHLTWARAWWPAGARIPALDAALLAVEISQAAHFATHLLDDDEAVERALQDAADAPAALASLPLSLASDGAELSAALTALADDHGAALLPASTTRAEWALAAGGTKPADSGIEVATGVAPVRWADVPAQTVDAEGEAHWALRQHAGTVRLRVEVPAVDAASAATLLRARFGPAESGDDVTLERDGNLFVGETAVAASVVFQPAGERTLWVRDPSLVSYPGAPDSAQDREHVLRFAADRLGSPHASLAERAAGAER